MSSLSVLLLRPFSHKVKPLDNEKPSEKKQTQVLFSTWNASQTPSSGFYFVTGFNSAAQAGLDLTILWPLTSQVLRQ